jgi:hypothetical protein
MHIASDFVVTGGVLNQSFVNLAKSVGFDTAIFGGGGGSNLTINSLAVNKLAAGDALFAGQATFAYSGGGKLTLNSAGLTIADKSTSPTATLTLASGSATFQNGSLNSLVATAYGVTIQDNTGAFVTVASGGILVQKGANYVNVTGGGVAIVGGSLTSPSITGGTISGSTMVLTANGVTTKINNSAWAGSYCGLIVQDDPTSPVNVSTVNSVGFGITHSGTGKVLLACSGGSGALSLWDVSGYSTVVGGGVLTINGTYVLNTSAQFCGNGVYCPSYAVTCSSLVVSGITAINTFGQWAGYGVNCPSYNVTCATVSCYSVSSTGAVTASIFNIIGGYYGQDALSGLVCGARTLYFKGGMLYAWS